MKDTLNTKEIKNLGDWMLSQWTTWLQIQAIEILCDGGAHSLCCLVAIITLFA